MSPLIPALVTDVSGLMLVFNSLRVWTCLSDFVSSRLFYTQLEAGIALDMDFNSVKYLYIYIHIY